MTARNILNTWFETGDFPTQAQFKELIASLFHRDEDMLTMDKVEGLDEALANYQNMVPTTSREFKVQRMPSVSSSSNFELPVKSILHAIDIRFVLGAPVVRIGTTNGGNELVSDRNILTGFDKNIPVRKSYPQAQTIYFTVSGGTVNILIDYETNYHII